MVWSSVSPDGTKSVKQNTSPMAANTAYTETNLNKDHFWNIGVDEDGYHRKVSMESYADTAIGAPVDALIPTGMDGVFYLKPANGSIQPFYRNAATIYQSVPVYLNGSWVSTANYTNIVAVPNESYGWIYVFTETNEESMAVGFFKASGGRVQTYAVATFLRNESVASTNIVFENQESTNTLIIRGKILGDTPRINLKYRVTYRAI